MIIYHATHAENLHSIMTTGVRVTYSQGKIPAVWGVKKSMIPWAFAHVCLRHGWRSSPPVVLEIQAEDALMHRFKGGLFYSLVSWEPNQIVRVLRLEDFARSPNTEAA